jgi:hypothetical protein
MRFPRFITRLTSVAALAGWASASIAQDASATQVPAPAVETVRVVSYNIENWRHNFDGFRLRKLAQQNPNWPQEFLDLIARESREDDEENWEVARVLLHPEVLPDILVVQEGATQSDANFFNTQFLKGHFEYIHQLKTNTDRDQHLLVMARPGFKVIEVREDYHEKPDTDNIVPGLDRIFARGPGFVLFETPGGHRLWVGTNHQKSRGFSADRGESGVSVARWRLAEAKATHEIIKDLAKTSTPHVLFLGDMNDEIGIQQYEEEAGGSGIEAIAGTGEFTLSVLTAPLEKSGEISFGGYRSARYRSLIDHAFATPALAPFVTRVHAFRGDLADVASDHYPIVVELTLPASSPTPDRNPSTTNP